MIPLLLVRTYHAIKNNAAPDTEAGTILRKIIAHHPKTLTEIDFHAGGFIHEWFGSKVFEKEADDELPDAALAWSKLTPTPEPLFLDDVVIAMGIPAAWLIFAFTKIFKIDLPHENEQEGGPKSGR